MSGSQTHGFDIVLETGLSSFVNLLHSTFIDDLPLRLSHVDFGVPVPSTTLTQNGFVNMPTRPTASVDVTAAGTAFTLDLRFPGTQITLDTVAGLPIGVGAPVSGLFPTGEIHAVLQLTMTAALSGSNNDLTIGQTSITVDPIGGLPGTVLAGVAGSARTAVESAIRSIFPIVLPVSLPLNSGCSAVGMIPFVPKLLPGSGSTVDSLAFLFARSGVTGRGGEITSSSVTTSSAGVITVANVLLRDVLCCLLPPVLGLPAPTTSGSCCTWPDMDEVNFAGTHFNHVRNLRICVGGTAVTFSGMLINEGWGWHANVGFTMNVRLRNDAGAIAPALDPPVLMTDAGIEWWVWLIAVLIVVVLAAVGAVLGFFAGGPWGAVGGGIAGFLVGFLIAALVVGVIAGAAAAAAALVGPTLAGVRGALGNLFLLPPDLTSRFGTLSLIGDPVIDDLRMRGVMTGNAPHPARASAADQILEVGQRIDLDRGVVLESHEEPMEADLEWNEDTLILGRRRGGSAGVPISVYAIHSQNAARLSMLALHFFAITEHDVENVIYPGGGSGISGFSIPVSDHEPLSPRVFAVRTTAGRYAKCAAWRDSHGRLHLRYHTYDTPLPLTLQSHWTNRRGAVVASGDSVFASWTDYEVERTGHVTAVPTSRLVPPITYRWFWNGAQISGSGTLAGTSATYSVSGASIDIMTAMGTPLAGELCAEATDHHGVAVDACAEFNLPGTTRETQRDQRFHEFELPPEAFRPWTGPGPDPAPDVVVSLPVREQFISAFAAGMKISPEKLEFH